jgi:hypothetical protein
MKTDTVTAPQVRTNPYASSTDEALARAAHRTPYFETENTDAIRAELERRKMNVLLAMMTGQAAVVQ